MLEYLRTLVKSEEVHFYLITFEQKHYALTVDQVRREQRILLQSGISWYPIPYHAGSFIVLKKIVDLFQAIFLMGKLRQLTKAKLLVTFTNLSASIGIICAHLFRLKMLVYCYEPHSDFLVELGIWRKGSIKHRISRWIELYAGKRADFVMASTKYVADLLTDFKVKGRVVRAPVSVDENKFLFKSKGREKIRQIYDLKNRNVFLYLGKFGYLYYNEEIAKLCKTLFDNIDNSFFLIVTSNDQETIRRMFQRNGLPEGSFFVTGNLSYEEVKDYISAADIGLSAVSPTPSQKFRSPTKVAEYLLCGLPYITCEGVSEDDIYAIKHNVGAVVKSFDENHIIESIFQIQNLLNEEKVSIRERCRNVGISYRGKSNIDQLFQQFFREIYVH
jgi:hypothetical protein